MIEGVHAMFYSPNADELRAFLKAQTAVPRSPTSGTAWLIFDAPRA
jgi:hypothetical protein